MVRPPSPFSQIAFLDSGPPLGNSPLLVPAKAHTRLDDEASASIGCSTNDKRFLVAQLVMGSVVQLAAEDSLVE